MPKKRLDTLLADLKLAESRQRAQALIMAGLVRVNGNPAEKSGTMVDEESEIEVLGKDHPYVSRGGVKLAHALDVFSINPQNAVCLDAGASTGGFTDCLLQRGAAKVWAIDVGENQLDYKLRTDPRVVSMEGVNTRSMDISVITDAIDIIVADVSFISLKLAIPPLLPLLKSGGSAVLLVKPQFEAGKDSVGKGGVVKDPKVRKKTLDGIIAFFTSIGLECLGHCESPISGRKGNIEYLVHLLKG